MRRYWLSRRWRVSHKRPCSSLRSLWSSPPPEPLAGLAHVALALGKMDEALTHAADVEALVDAGHGGHASAASLWICHPVVRAANGSRANEILARAHSLLTE